MLRRQPYIEDEDVQFHWALVSADIHLEDHSQQLLSEVISLWVTIRGFSLAASWMEELQIR